MSSAALTGLIRSDVLPRWAVAFAIVLLLLAGFYADRAFDEPITGYMGPALYALYALGLLAYAAVISGVVPWALTSAAGGILGVGALVSALMGLLGILGALFTLFLLTLVRANPSVGMRLAGLAAGLLLVVSVLSPWLTAFALGHVTFRTLQACTGYIGKARAIAWCIVGIVFVAGTMGLAQKVDADWRAPRTQSFQTADLTRWEKSLEVIKTNWFCGRRRCLMPICGQLFARFGWGAGEDGFAPIIGFGVDAPKAPPEFDVPFTKVYGRPIRQVCAIGD